MNFKQAEQILLSRHSLIKKNSLDFLYPIFEKLGNPQDKLGSVIHVTGTNGKGSVCAYMESALRGCGFKTALYTSPHIYSLRERIKFDGKEISEKEFIEVFEKVYPLCRDLTFFEIMTVIAFVWFSKKKPDFSVIEVGIGGLYDTTNVIKNTKAALITSVALDHTDLLGDSVEKIAAQKAGIIKKGSFAVYPPLPKKAENEIKKAAYSAGARLLKTNDIFERKKNLKNKAETILYSKKEGKFKILIFGEKQGINISLVLKTLKELSEEYPGIVLQKVKKGLEKAFIPARFQIISKKISGLERTIIIDGAHNEQAVLNLTKTLDKTGFKPKILVFSLMSSKDHKNTLKLLSKRFNKVFFTSADKIKSYDPSFLADEFVKHDSKADVCAVSEPGAAFSAALKEKGDILICGSFYLAALALKKFRR
ncbi:MAG: Mur ligase family protein [Elusimicrobiota bacterium]